ncbi:hypothetical protein [Methylotenera sp. L2L1]|uniref:hypothetical protein n=1 Tax=Methylotenera sp. L2L1 TaxID=1502770 RepID=UPI00055F48B9|nr:hypothetical protein [Methylotenera sp. L2L1]
MSRIDSANPYRVQGTVISIAELAKKNPNFVISATPAQIEELKLHDEQTALREAAGARYANQHPDQIYAQVVSEGKVLATVYDSGITTTQQNIPGLKLSENGQGLALAKTRLDELMQAISGKVIYSNFVQPKVSPSSNIPDSALPSVTARGLNEMVRDMDWARVRSRMVVDETPKA